MDDDPPAPPPSAPAGMGGGLGGLDDIFGGPAAPAAPSAPTDKVLLPADKDIVATASALPDFSILVEAVVAAGLASTLQGAGPFTVFAPTNAAFAALLTELGVTKDALLANKTLLTQVLTYHVVPARVLKAEVPVNTAFTTVQGLTFTINSSLVITDQNMRTSNIVTADVFTSNGVIHVVDKVILPK